MVFSKFNYVVKIDYYCCYNTKIGDFYYSKKFNFNGELQEHTNYGEEELNELNKLKKMGFIVDANINEADDYIRQTEQCLQRPSWLHLTICPTMKCNFRCIYCYQEYNAGSLNEDKLFDSVKKILEAKKNIKKLDVEWFGGEPLLKIGIICRIGEYIKNFCMTNSIQLNSSITTNGSLLKSDAVANKLKELNFSFFQITIDGSPEIHNDMRPYDTNMPSFDDVIKGIKNALKISNVILRINVSKVNLTSIKRLLLILYDYRLLDKIHISLGHLKSFAGFPNKQTFSTYEYSFIEYRILKQLIEIGVRCDDLFPIKPVARYCDYEFSAGYAIDSEGLFYDCDYDLGNKNNASEHFDINKHTVIVSKCMNCKLLPICMGGCKHFNECPSYAYSFAERLKTYFNYFIIEKIVTDEE